MMTNHSAVHHIIINEDGTATAKSWVVPVDWEPFELGKPVSSMILPALISKILGITNMILHFEEEEDNDEF